MTKKKLTLEDLKLDSFLTEMDDSKLTQIQGGNFIIVNPNPGTGTANTGACQSCDCPTASDASFKCSDSAGAECDTSNFTNFTKYYTCGSNCQD